MAKHYQTIRGAHDILPEQQVALRHVESIFFALAEQSGFGRIDTPILEEAGVFQRSVGEHTDIVAKEMYVFADRSGNEVALRPEMTAPIVRAYLEHGMGSLPQPVKLYYSGPAFRYDRPQAGRQRQFHQLGVEVLGSSAASIDAGVILLARRFYQSLGLGKVQLQINSIGDNISRKKYIKELSNYLSDYESKLSETDRARLKENPLRILDSKDDKTQSIVKNGPQILDYLNKESRAHFTEVLEYLDELGVEYELNPYLVRGLDYYTHTVFEFYGHQDAAQNSLGAGGRYDGLVETMGGKSTPAVGFALGLERILNELEGAGALQAVAPTPQVYVASLGEPARVGAFVLMQRLLNSGIATEGSHGKGNIQAQLSKADKAGVTYAVIIGQKEIFDKTAILRDMRTGTQEVLPEDKMVDTLKKYLQL